MPRAPTVIDVELEKYANPHQLNIIRTVNRLGSGSKAAKVLGVGKSGINEALARVKREAARQGYSPEHSMTRTVPDGFQVARVSTNFKADGSIGQQWVIGTPDKERQRELFEMFVATLAEDVKPLKKLPSYPRHVDEDIMCVFPLGDPHYGLHAWWADAGEDFDLKIAEDLTRGAIDRLVSVAPRAGTALLLNLGDMYHADNQKNLTQSGHQLDVDGRWAKVQQVGLRSMIHAILRMLEKFGKVVFRINRGNHDGHSAYALALMLSCYFHNEPRVEVDLSPAAVWYYRFGQNLIGSTHGDTIKGPDMVSIMAADRPEDWGSTKFRMWLVGHVHHQDVKEYRGCVVEYFRTLAARDAWHAGQGYRAGRDMRCIVLHKDLGETERHRCDVGMLK